MTFKEKIKAGKFLVTVEFGPEKGTETQPFIDIGKSIADRVDGFNVTDLQSAVMRLGSLALCIKLKEAGLEPILQMTCRDRNRIGLQSDLLGASALGIKNVLCMTGDHVTAGDHKQAKPVYDVESVQLLKIVDTLNNGRDMAGNELKGATDFLQGAVVTPESNPIEPQLIKFVKKVSAGAKFFQTQAIFDIEKFRIFMSCAKEYSIKILAGIVVLKSVGMANFMNNHIPGIKVPQDLIDELKASDKENVLDTGLNIAARLIRQLKDENICDGVHIMAPGMEDKVPVIMEMAGLS